MRGVSLKQLRTFDTVARLGSYSRAAKVLYLSQPAVSMQISELTNQAQVPLFERIGKKLRITEAGDILLQHVRVILRELDSAEEAFDQIRGLKIGSLNIVAVSTAKYFAPHLLAQFMRQQQKMALRLQIHNRERTIELLNDNEVDFAIMGRAPSGSVIRAESFAEHLMGFIARPDNELANQSAINPNRLADQPIIVRESGSGTRTTMDQFFSLHNISPSIAMEAASNETIKQAVMAGLGVAFISLQCITLEVRTQSLKVLPITGTPIRRKWHVAMHKNKQLMPTALAARQFILTYGQKYLTSVMEDNFEPFA